VEFETWACFFTGFIILYVLYKCAVSRQKFNGINVWKKAEQKLRVILLLFLWTLSIHNSDWQKKKLDFKQKNRNNLSSSNSLPQLSRLSSPQLEDEKGFRNVIRQKFIISRWCKQGEGYFFLSVTLYLSSRLTRRKWKKFRVSEVH
jgi:hypothetical protein